MKILVLGCKGQLGRCLNDQLSNIGQEAIYTSREKIDISDFEDTKNKILEIAPDVVINATAYTFVDKADYVSNDASEIRALFDWVSYNNMYPMRTEVVGNDLVVEFIYFNNFAGANLEQANFKNADLSFINFANTNLKNADLSGSNLSYAGFQNANLEGANLEGVIIENTGLKCINHEICN